jgi:hypothetical protein
LFAQRVGVATALLGGSLGVAAELLAQGVGVLAVLFGLGCGLSEGVLVLIIVDMGGDVGRTAPAQLLPQGLGSRVRGIRAGRGRTFGRLGVFGRTFGRLAFGLRRLVAGIGPVGSRLLARFRRRIGRGGGFFVFDHPLGGISRRNRHVQAAGLALDQLPDLLLIGPAQGTA